MINLKDKIFDVKYKYLIFIHILLGFLSPFTAIPVIIFGYYIIIKGITKIASGNSIYYLLTLIYFVSYEFYCRISKTNPLIPYEIAKYLVLILTLIYYLAGNKRNKLSITALILFFFAIPSFLYLGFDDGFNFKAGEELLNSFVFNFLGFFSIILITSVLDHYPLNYEIDLKNSLKTFVLPIISILVHLTVKTPNISEIEFTLESNYEASGGFGPNQAATILGVAIFFLFIYTVMFDSLWLKFPFGFTDSLLLMLYTFFRALLTFSRGGVISSLFLIGIFFIIGSPTGLSGGNAIKITNAKIFLVLVLIGSTFLFLNSFTDNKLLLRYQGETVGTLEGTKEKDFNSITSGRENIYNRELELFYDNPIFGVGPGLSTIKRYERFNELENSHNEFGRLLAEHGIFGIFIIITLFFTAIRKTISPAVRFTKFFVGSLFFISLFSASHSAMRLLVTPLLFGLACANFYSIDSKKNLEIL
jgi:hypothetical protein